MVERFGKAQSALGRIYLKEWRSHRGMTQEQLADAIQSTHVTVSRMERGDRPYNQPFLEACADALSCDPADIIAGPPESNEKLQIIFDLLKGKSQEELDKVAAMISLLGE